MRCALIGKGATPGGCNSVFAITGLVGFVRGGHGSRVWVASKLTIRGLRSYEPESEAAQALKEAAVLLRSAGVDFIVHPESVEDFEK
jgi:hypothetical protein